LGNRIDRLRLARAVKVVPDFLSKFIHAAKPLQSYSVFGSGFETDFSAAGGESAATIVTSCCLAAHSGQASTSRMISMPDPPRS
jgi:hypothetical protein